VILGGTLIVCLEELLDWFAAGEMELHSRLEPGNDVVII